MRTVGVKLEAETGKYTRDVDSAGKSTRGLKDEIDGVGRSSETTGRRVDGLGGDFRDTARDARKLQNEIQAVQRSLAGLAVEFAAAGTASDRLDLTKSMRKQQGELRQLLRVDKLLPTPNEVKPAAQNFGKQLVAGVSSAVGSSPLMVQGFAIAAVAASPLIGASVAAAVVGGAGVGGVIGGLVLAARDPRVKQAGTDLGQQMLGDLQRRADVFIAPALDGVRKVRVAWDGFDGDLARIFNSSARFVGPLVDGLLSGAVKIGHGFADAVSQARPVIDALGRSVDRIGGAAGDFLSKMSKHADDGARALDDLTGATVGFINVTGDIIGDLATLYGWLSKANDAVESFTHGLSIVEMLDPTRPFKMLYDGLKSITGAADEAGHAVRRTGSNTFGYATAAAEAAGQQDIMNAAMRGGVVTAATLTAGQNILTGAQQALQLSLESLGGATSLQGLRATALKQAMDNLYGATIRNVDANETYQASWDSLSAAVRGNGRTLNVHTTAGRANRDALEALLTSNNELYTANIAAGVSVAQATKKHEARTEAVKAESRRLGLNKTETQRLIDTYGRIPERETTDLVLRSVDRVADALLDLAAIQLHLAKGTPLPGDLSRRLARAQYGMPDTKRAYGGPLPGHAPHDRADNMVYAGTPGEWVIQKPTVRKVLRQYGPAAMDHFNQYGELPEYADGGLLKASRTQWPRNMTYRVTAGMTKVPPLDWVISKVPGGSGAAFVRAQDGKPYGWANAGPNSYDCSGIVSAVYNVLHGRNPYSHTFSTSSLPGRWFTKSGIGGPLTAAWSNPGEYPASSSTGHMMGMVGGLTFESSGSRGVHLGASTRRLTDFAHIAHYGRGGRIAMAGGGVIREPVVGVGASGRTYSFGENGAETVMPGAYIPGGAAPATAGGPTYHISVAVSPLAHPAEVGRQVVGAIQAYEKGSGKTWRNR